MPNIETTGSKINVKISRVFLLLQGWKPTMPLQEKTLQQWGQTYIWNQAQREYLAAAITIAPQILPICTAAVPTPPPAPSTRSTCYVETPPLRPFPSPVVVTNHTNNLCKTTLRFHIFAHFRAKGTACSSLVIECL